MGRYTKGLSDSNKPVDQQTTKPSKYSSRDMELVNAAGFKVPRCVRAHWAKEAVGRDEKISQVLREFLAERYGLPDELTLKDITPYS